MNQFISKITSIAVCRSLSKQKVSQSIERVGLGALHRINDVVFAFGHLFTVDRPVRVNEQALWWFKTFPFF